MLKSVQPRHSREIFRSEDSLQNRLKNNNMCLACDTNNMDKQDGLPKYSSPLTMIQKVGGVDRKIRVVLKVYSTMYGMYAVVSQDRIIVKDCGYINLKSCSILTNEKDLTVQIIQRNCEGLALKFKVTDVEEHKKLLSVLQSEDKQLEVLEERLSEVDYEGNPIINRDSINNKENQLNHRNQSQGRYHANTSSTESKLNKMWKRDLSPRSPCGSRKGSLPALDESEENSETSESDNEEI